MSALIFNETLHESRYPSLKPAESSGGYPSLQPLFSQTVPGNEEERSPLEVHNNKHNMRAAVGAGVIGGALITALILFPLSGVLYANALTLFWGFQSLIIAEGLVGAALVLSAHPLRPLEGEKDFAMEASYEKLMERYPQPAAEFIVRSGILTPTELVLKNMQSLALDQQKYQAVVAPPSVYGEADREEVGGDTISPPGGLEAVRGESNVGGFVPSAPDYGQVEGQ